MDLDTDINQETDMDQACDMGPGANTRTHNSCPPSATGIPGFSRSTTTVSIGGVSFNKDLWLTDTPGEFSSSTSKLPLEDSRKSTPRPASKGRKISVAPYDPLLPLPPEKRKVACRPIFIVLAVIIVIILLATALSVGVLLGMGTDGAPGKPKLARILL